MLPSGFSEAWAEPYYSCGSAGPSLRFQSYVNCQGTWKWSHYQGSFLTETAPALWRSVLQSCLWDVRSSVVALPTGSGIWHALFLNRVLHCKNSWERSHVHDTMQHPSNRFGGTQLPAPSILPWNALGHVYHS